MEIFHGNGNLDKSHIFKIAELVYDPIVLLIV